MEDMWNKIGAVVAAIISALGGLYLHDRKTTNRRLDNLEKGSVQDRMDIKVMEVRFTELKEDTSEIKSLLRELKNGSRN